MWFEGWKVIIKGGRCLINGNIFLNHIIELSMSFSVTKTELLAIVDAC